MLPEWNRAENIAFATKHAGKMCRGKDFYGQPYAGKIVGYLKTTGLIILELEGAPLLDKGNPDRVCLVVGASVGWYVCIDLELEQSEEEKRKLAETLAKEVMEWEP